jgi:peptidoglycan hydrolase CwlO-like protein
MRPDRSTALAVLALVTAGGLGLWLLAPAPSGAAPGLGELRSQAEQQRAREQALSGDLARIGRLVSDVERQLRGLERRRAEVEAELAADQARLARLQAELRAERIRLARLRARLAEARRVLSARMVALYKSGEPELITIVLRAKGFGDLVEQAAFLRRIGSQDSRIIDNVRGARHEAKAAVRRLARDEERQARITAAVEARRNAVASMARAVAERRATLVQARAVRATALQATRASRQSVEKRIAKLEAAQARAANAVGPGGPWVIPWPIVQCESGGQNVPPNWAGASGYYQIIPSTWKLFGGSGPHAYLASKSEQDQVASRIWNGGKGASNWDCYAIVNG